MDLMNLQNRKILITGASSGIGRAASILVSQLNASVVLCGRNEEALKKTMSMMHHPEKHHYISFDVKEFETYEEVFREAVSDSILLDGLVHCAGIARVTPVRMLKPSIITEIMETNFYSFMSLVNMYAKKKYSCGGSIVAVSAANAHYPQKCMSVYASSKAAVEAAVKTMALELSAQKIRINCVVPGAVDTPMMQASNEEALQKILGNQLLGAGKPEDIANVIAFLLSDAASFITGRSLYADGGMLGQ